MRRSPQWRRRLGITKTHLKPGGGIRVAYFAINAPRPPPERGRNSGGVTLLFRTAGGVKRIYKHAGNNFQMVIAQVGKGKCGVAYISPIATRTETEECLRILNTQLKRKLHHWGRIGTPGTNTGSKIESKGRQTSLMGHRKELGDSTSKRLNL